MNDNFLNENILIYIIIAMLTLCILLVVIAIFRNGTIKSEIRDIKQDKNNINSSLRNFGELISGNQKEANQIINQRLFELNQRFSSMAVENEQKLENIRLAMEKKIGDLRDDNNRQLEMMRNTVDEKLQKTLEDRISRSFQLVNERLEQVYKGLGEMQSLASGVGDLKKVLTNVKTRGILGEVQLGAILEQILSQEQYEENVKTRPNSNERVEFAVKLPGNGDERIWLPIDAKFPADSYSRLVEAYDVGDTALIKEAAKLLELTIKQEAKDIHTKYVEPPYTTDFAIMFLPFEGLYAEVVRRGLLETLQREYKVNVAGPTTMAALLNSLQLGFKTLAIQKHTSEVWDVLGAVKTEFDKFGEALEQTQTRINQANAELDKLIGTRTRTIQRKLRNVTALEEGQAKEILGLAEKDGDYRI